MHDITTHHDSTQQTQTRLLKKLKEERTISNDNKHDHIIGVLSST